MFTTHLDHQIPVLKIVIRVWNSEWRHVVVELMEMAAHGASGGRRRTVGHIAKRCRERMEYFLGGASLKPLDSTYKPSRTLRQHAEEVKVGHGGEPLIYPPEDESGAGNASLYPALYSSLPTQNCLFS